MNRIHLLDEKISSRIAAGEVVVNPAAVVKELVENSIDAGADAVTVEIADGGRELIRVTDNGSGVVAGDVPLMIQKHATSKISSINDLGAIQTLGFRGEALSSMAAVSRFSVSTRTKDSISGTTLKVSGGGQPEVNPAGLPEGTTIKVENLFYNIPARKKFLKSGGSETAKVTAAMSKLILSNPGIAFKYINNGKLVYQSPGSGSLQDALTVIYGKGIVDQVREVAYSDSFVKIAGYISKPAFLYKTSANISFFLNGRYFQSKRLQEALMDGYGERILRSHFPLAVLDIHVSFDAVDVNVHPNKLQLLLFQEQQVLEAVKKAAGAALSQNEPPALRVTDKPKQPGAFPIHKSNGDTVRQTPRRSFSDIRSADRLYHKQPAQKVATSAAAVMKPDIFLNGSGYERVLDKILQDTQKPITHQQTEIEDVRRLKDYRILGQAFDTYIVCETQGALYIIDQHAAHERLTYEAMKKNMESGERFSQFLLVPAVKKFNQSEFDTIGEHMDLLSALGFELEEFGALTYRITALPVQADPVQIDSLLDEVIFEIERKKDVVLMRDNVIRAACRHSIKAGMQLSDTQISYLVGEITGMEKIPTCPHGRPIAVVLTKTDLQKGFKRTI